MTRRLLSGTVAACVLLLAAYGGRTEEAATPPAEADTSESSTSESSTSGASTSGASTSGAGKPDAGKSDLERLRADVQSLTAQLAQLKPRPADAGAGPAEAAAAEAGAADAGAAEAGAKELAGGYVNVKHFGAKGEGVTDDTAALQAALDAAGNNAPWGTRGTVVFVPPGEYLISATLNVYRMSFEMVGCGPGNSPAYAASPGMGSVFRWNGPPDTPMMKVRDSYGVAIRRVRWEGKEGVAGTTAINLNWVTEDQQAGNAATVIEQCHFGRYAHTTQGIHKGDLAHGILMDGDNGNNDEFKVDRCVFSNCKSAGIRMVNTQSIWGSVTDCTISECGAGIETASSLTGYNLCFDACGPDFRIASTARVSVFGWQSERSRKLAEVGPYAALTADGGVIQLSAIADGVMIGAFPSDASQVDLRRIRFTQNGLSPRPAIRFGASEKDGVVGLNFRVKVVDCEGLYPDQFQLAGALFATVPESRGEVEFRGTADKFYHFHNFLRMHPASARTLDPSRVDLAVADAAPANVNAPGPIGVQWTAARVYAGSGSPENAVAAAVGSLYLRTDGSGGATLYVKENGTDNTGWVAK